MKLRWTCIVSGLSAVIEKIKHQYQKLDLPSLINSFLVINKFVTKKKKLKICNAEKSYTPIV